MRRRSHDVVFSLQPIAGAADHEWKTVMDAVICNVGGTQTVLTFVGHGRQFENDSLTNWKPM